MQQDNIMPPLRGPIAGMDGILISTAIDETGNDMSDTQSMPPVKLALRILCFHIAAPIALNPSGGCVPTPSRAFGLMRPDIGATALG
ncbi:MAG: hypothetical protein E5X58_40220 [Mesorhizobium sp.]|nr:MAG: hypothetical protein E5X58_40220 [Mesorhizobium sp.]BCH17983.1 hypothetical protein MesoLjLa_48340 [Mesorhizobium sp. L-2-11]